MTLWIGNGAVLKSFSQWQLKEFRKLNNSWPDLFIFQNSFNPFPNKPWFLRVCSASL